MSSSRLAGEKKRRRQSVGVRIEVSIGELADKVSILFIKRQRLRDPVKRQNVVRELERLFPLFQRVGLSEKDTLFDRLKAVNEVLWEIEDAIRKKEAEKSFDAEFIRLAREVYFKNDERSRIKREINLRYGSELIEEKEYTPY